jgi:hypothetical protein
LIQSFGLAVDPPQWYFVAGERDEEGEPNMNAALPFFLLGLPLVLAAYDLGRVRPEGTFGGFPWKNLASDWSRQP